MKPTIVCLCGSARFSGKFLEVDLRETLKGKIVLSIGGRGLPDREFTMEEKATIDELHLRKIDLADEILIIDVGEYGQMKGYIGHSTRNELNYALRLGKSIRFLTDEEEGKEE